MQRTRPLAVATLLIAACLALVAYAVVLMTTGEWQSSIAYSLPSYFVARAAAVAAGEWLRQCKALAERKDAPREAS